MEFARTIGVSLATLQNWEQGHSRPEGPARALFKVAAVNPQTRCRGLGQLAAFLDRPFVLVPIRGEKNDLRP